MLSRISKQLISTRLLSRRFATYPTHEVVPLPALSPTMEMGGIAKWSIKEGDAIAAGDIIVEIETDKATVDFEAQDDAFLAKILLHDGTSDVAVGTPMAVLVEEESDIAAFANYVPDIVPEVAAPPSTSPSPSLTSTSSTSSTSSASSPSSSPAPTGRTPTIQFRHGARELINESLGRSSSTPLIAHDMLPATTPIAGDPRGYEDLPLTAMRKIIAGRLTESKATIPHYYR